MLSRIAEQLYWTGRYTERAEDTSRLVEVIRRAGLEGFDEPATTSAMVGILGGTPTAGVSADPFVYFTRTAPRESIAACVRSARENARTIRESVTSEMWESLNAWHLMVSETTPDRLVGGALPVFLSAMRRNAYVFAGATQGTMLREEGHHWLLLGRHLERLSFICRVLSVREGILAMGARVSPTAQEQYAAALLLQILSAAEPYRRTYQAAVRPIRVAEFLLFDADFPRSAVYSAVEVASCTTLVGLGESSGVRRVAGRLAAELQHREIREVMTEGLSTYVQRIRALASGVHEALAESAFARAEFGPTVRSSV